MKLSNPHELTQLHWEITSLIGVVKSMTGQTPNIEINPGQNQRCFNSLIWGIRKHLDRLENDFNEAHKKRMQEVKK